MMRFGLVWVLIVGCHGLSEKQSLVEVLATTYVGTVNNFVRNFAIPANDMMFFYLSRERVPKSLNWHMIHHLNKSD